MVYLSEFCHKLTGKVADLVDPEVLGHAAAAVLHYFRNDLNQTEVMPGDFSLALEKALHGLGLNHLEADAAAAAQRVVETDLCQLLEDGLELFFFERLRAELRRQLAPAPALLRFRGLHDCAMRLSGTRRWTARCQARSDQIVEFLRTALGLEPIRRPCGLMVT